jgi:hypothetical protein
VGGRSRRRIWGCRDRRSAPGRFPFARAARRPKDADHRGVPLDPGGGTFHRVPYLLRPHRAVQPPMLMVRHGVLVRSWARAFDPVHRGGGRTTSNAARLSYRRGTATTIDVRRVGARVLAARILHDHRDRWVARRRPLLGHRPGGPQCRREMSGLGDGRTQSLGEPGLAPAHRRCKVRDPRSGRLSVRSPRASATTDAGDRGLPAGLGHRRGPARRLGSARPSRRPRPAPRTQAAVGGRSRSIDGTVPADSFLYRPPSSIWETADGRRVTGGPDRRARTG